MRIQLGCEDAQDSHQEAGSNNRKASSNNRCSIPRKTKVTETTKIKKQGLKIKRLKHLFRTISKGERTITMVGRTARKKKDINKQALKGRRTEASHKYIKDKSDLIHSDDIQTSDGEVSFDQNRQLDMNDELCESSMDIDTQDSGQSTEKICNFVSNNSPMDFSELVSISDRHDYRSISNITNKEFSSSRPDIGLCTPINYKISNMHVAYLQECLQKKGISQQAIELTQELHFTNDQKIAVFLSNVRSHNPAAIDTIANWLKDIIRHLAPEGKAKNIRILLVLLAQNGDADLNVILVLKNWSSLNIYQYFYQRGIKLMLEQNNITEKFMNQARNI
ncbi:19264_t:CDS:2 [Racocetra persica]|uniref:19264_t:CDS:1 n=1 Tax=Racocetra persica TaxID=160502 RepID=A0ACA9KIL3_9GLOM|nr:19264_t:CDS:2 [Racocetra persica]